MKAKVAFAPHLHIIHRLLGAPNHNMLGNDGLQIYMLIGRTLIRNGSLFHAL